MTEVYETVISVEESVYSQFREIAMKNGFRIGRLQLNRRAAYEEAMKLFISKYKSEIVIEEPEESAN